MLRLPYPYRQRHAAEFVGYVKLRRVLGRPETHFAIEANRELAGGIGLATGSGVNASTAELSYWLGESFWGRGIASAAVRALTPYAFRRLGLKRVVALPFAGNRASCRVLEKAGFRREAIQRASAAKRGVVHDQWVYAVGDHGDFGASQLDSVLGRPRRSEALHGVRIGRRVTTVSRTDVERMLRSVLRALAAEPADQVKALRGSEWVKTVRGTV